MIDKEIEKKAFVEVERVKVQFLETKQPLPFGAIDLDQLDRIKKKEKENSCPFCEAGIPVREIRGDDK